MNKYNVRSVKIKTLNKDNIAISTDWMVFKQKIPTYDGEKSVTKAKNFEAKDSKQLMRKMMRMMRYRASVGKSFVMIVSTTRGQLYFSNCK